MTWEKWVRKNLFFCGLLKCAFGVERTGRVERPNFARAGTLAIHLESPHNMNTLLYFYYLIKGKTVNSIKICKFREKILNLLDNLLICG